ncbi:hypothetical protein FQN50_004591 [Emmonsiellopsis sp. PD_5]|nr:hypothetical protein FQN50_004591 [Emmonsiellopsis sp. PD_5]
MASPKLVTVFGATGNQGGSVIRSLLRNSTQFRVRGITRNLDSDKAKELAKAGVEVVKADGFKKDELVNAFKDSWAVFANTNSSDPAFDDPNGPREVDLGRVIVDAINEVGVEHFVYSSAANVYGLTEGDVKLDMMDNKYKIEQLARNSPNIKAVTAVNAGWYLENFTDPFIAEIFGEFPFQADSEGFITLAQPPAGGNGLIPFLGIEEDYGDLVHGILLNPSKWAGKVVQGTGELATVEDLVAAFAKVTGKKSRYVATKVEEFPTMGIRALEDVKGMFVFTQRFNGQYFGTEFDPEPAKELKRAVQEVVGAKDGSPKVLETAEKFFEKMFSEEKRDV